MRDFLEPSLQILKDLYDMEGSVPRISGSPLPILMIFPNLILLKITVIRSLLANSTRFVVERSSV